MAACWKGIGSLLSECVPSIIETGSNASVAPDTQRCVLNGSSQSATGGDGTNNGQVADSTEMTLSRYRTGVCGQSSTRYSSYTVQTDIRNSFLLATPERYSSSTSPIPDFRRPSCRQNRAAQRSAVSDSGSEQTSVSTASPSVGSSHTGLLPSIILPGFSSTTANTVSDTTRPRKTVLDRRRRTNSCSCDDSSRPSRSSNSGICLNHQNGGDIVAPGRKRHGSRSSNVSNSNGSNSDDNGSHSGGTSAEGFLDALEMRNRPNQPRSRRRSSSLSAGIIGLGGRGPNARYLIVRPMTNTVTHTIGE